MAITVNTLADENDTYIVGGTSNSLREAISHAATLGGTDNIEFDSSLCGGVIQLQHGQLVIGTPVNINGLGAEILTIRAASGNRVITVNADAMISGLTITGGSSAQGGGLYANADLTLDGVRIAGNMASTHGGGLYVNSIGSAIVRNSTIENNQAVFGAGIYSFLQGAQKLKVHSSTIANNRGATSFSMGGGILIQSPGGGSGTAEIHSSTISQNIATHSGGIRIIGPNMHADIVSSTIAFNRGDESGGIQLSSATATLHSTIIAENTNSAGTTALDVWGSLNPTSSFNLIGRGGSGSLQAGGITQNIILEDDQTAGLAPLADNAGPTRTHGLFEDSLAIDAVAGNPLSTDQRGFSRSVRLKPGTGNNTDIGAVERGFTVSEAGDVVDGNYSSGHLTLRDAIDLAAQTPGKDEIRFSPSVVNSGLIKLNSQLAINAGNNVAIIGPGGELLTIDAQNNSRIFRFQNVSDAEIVGVTLTHGSAAGTSEADKDGGAIYAIGSMLAIRDSSLVFNSAVDDAGGLYAEDSQIIIDNSMFDQNKAGVSADNAGGAAYIQRGRLDMSDSTFQYNSAGSGGAIFEALDDSTKVFIRDSLIENNTAIAGGGAFNIQTSTGIKAIGEVSIQRTTIRENTAPNGAGIYQSAGTLVLSSSALVSNVARDRGGAVYVASDLEAHSKIVNSTIAENSAGLAGGGVLVANSVTTSAKVDVLSSTIAYNSVTAAGGGGGISNGDGTGIYLQNAVLASNRSGADGTPNDVYGALGGYDGSHVSSYNLIGAGDVFAINLVGSFNQAGSGTFPLNVELSELGNYGGPTPSIVPLPGSPAIDSGPDSSGVGPGDQRGFSRVVNGAIDRGAIETFSSVIASADFNGDEWADSATLDPSTGNLIVTLGNGVSNGGGVWGKLDPSQTWNEFKAGDFNGDGRDDIWLRQYGFSNWSIAISDGAKFNIVDSGGAYFTNNWTNIYSGDFDGDDADELLGWNIISARWETLEYDDRHGMSLKTTWGNALAPIPTLQPLTIGDVDNDGRDDLVAYDTTGGGSWKVALSHKQTDGTDRFVTFVNAAADWNSWFGAAVPAPNDPLDVKGRYQVLLDTFSDIYNNIELEFYPGLMKGSAATSQTKSGNPWDQAALLVEYLKSVGVVANISTGSVRASYEDVTNWLGVKNSNAAYLLLREAFDPGATFDDANQRFTFTHAWVRAVVPTAQGLQWVNIDPSWKFKSIQPGVSVTTSGGSGLLTSFDSFAKRHLFTLAEGSFVKDQLPIEAYEDQVMSYLASNPSLHTKSLADIPYEGPILNRRFTTIPVMLTDGPQVLTSTANYSDLQTIINDNSPNGTANQLTHRVELTITTSHSNPALKTLVKMLIVPKSALDTNKIWYTPGTSGKVVPHLTIDGEDHSMAEVATNSTVTIAIKHLDPDQFGDLSGFDNKTDTYTRTAGQIVIISLDANQYSTQQIATAQAQLNDELTTIGAEEIDDLLSYTGAKYWHEYNRDSRILAGLTHTVDVQQRVGSGLITSDATYTVPDHLDFPLVPDDMNVDLKNWVMKPVPLGTADATFNDIFRLMAFNASALENSVLEEVINAESISTVKGIQLYLDAAMASGSTSAKVLVVERNPDDPALNPGGSPRYRITTIATKDGVQATGFPQLWDEFQLRSALLLDGQNGVEDGVIEKLNTTGQLNRIWIPIGTTGISGSPGWTGTIYIHESIGSTARLQYLIQQTGSAPGNGGYRGGAVVPPKPVPTATSPRQTTHGDPVNVANGNNSVDEVDFTFANPIIPLDFARHYDSQNQLDVGFGAGWVHGFTGFVYQEQDPEHAADTDYVWLNGKGERHIFEDTDFHVPNTLYGKTKTSGGLTEFQDKDGTRYIFTPFTFNDAITGKTVVARLTAIKNAAADQGVNIAYVGNTVRVDQVTSNSSPGRYLKFDYNPDTTISKVKRFESNKLISEWIYVVAPHPELGPVNNKRLTKVLHAGDLSIATNYEYYRDGSSGRKGRIKKISQPNGEFHTYEYYANGRVFRVTDSAGKQVTYNYNLFRNLTEATDERGNVETYLFQDNGLTTRQIHPDRSRIEHTWGVPDTADEFLMTSTTDEQGAKETFTYVPDSQGKLQHSIGKDGLITTYKYWSSPDVNYQYISRLRETVVDDTPTGSKITTQYTYDNVGNMLSMTDPESNTTRYEYYGPSDGAYRSSLRKSETLPKGVNSTSTEDVPWEVLTNNFTVTGDTLSVQLLASTVQHRFVFIDAIRIDRLNSDGIYTRIIDDSLVPNANFRLERSDNSLELSSPTTYGNKNIYNFADIPNGSPAATWIFRDLEPGTYRISATWQIFGPGSPYDTTATYRVYDGLVGTVAPVTLPTKNQRDDSPNDFYSFQTVYNYDQAGNPVAAITEGLPAGYNSYDSRGNVVYQEDAAGVATINQYDAQGRLVKTGIGQSEAFNFATSPALSPLYDFQPTLWETRDLGDTIHLFGNTRKAFDLNYQVTPNSVLEFDFEAPVSGNYYGLSIHNSLTQNEIVGFHLAGTDPNNYGLWRRDFDGYQIASGTRHYRIPLGQYLAPGTYGYIIFVNANTLGGGAGESYFSDVRVYESASSGAVNTTKFTYDLSGRVISTTDALGRTTTNIYNAIGKLEEQKFADGTSIKHYYDAAGNCIAITDERENTTRFVYDKRNRVIQTIFADGSSTRNRYDGAGRVVESTDEMGRQTAFSYDRNGRLLKTARFLEFPENSTAPVEEVVSANEYDHVGNLVKVIDPNGNVTINQYDRLGRVIETRTLDENDFSQPPVLFTTTSYDSNGHIASQDTYDAAQVAAEDIAIPSKYANPFVNFESKSLLSYHGPNSDTLDRNGAPESQNAGRILYMNGDSRKAVDLNYVVTANTVLEFDFSTASGWADSGSLFGIGIGNSLNATPTLAFKLTGSLSVSSPPWSTAYAPNTPHSVNQHYIIPVGEFLSSNAYGNYRFLEFINNSNTSNGKSYFSNVRFYEKEGTKIDFSNATFQSYIPRDDPNQASVYVADTGRTVFLSGDAWKMVDLGYHVTPSTVLDVTFRDISTQANLHGIAFAHNTIESISVVEERIFKFYGADPDDFIDFADFSPSEGRRRFHLPIGKYLTSGYYEYLMLINDNAYGYIGDSAFTDIEIYEGGLSTLQEAAEENAHVAKTAYDAFGRPIQVTNADGSQVSTIYDAAGRVRYNIDELRRKTENRYDKFGRLERTIAPDPDGLGPQTSPYTRYERDLAGNVVKQWEFFGTNGLTNVEYAGRFVYDSRNRLVTTIRKDGTQVSNVLDRAGQLVATVDALGNTTYSVYDTRGRVVEQREADPDGNGSGFAPVTKHEYDSAGNIERTTDPLGNEIEFKYDSLNRLRKTIRKESIIVDDSSALDDSSFAVNSDYRQPPLVRPDAYGGDATVLGDPEAAWTFASLEDGRYTVSISFVSLESYAETYISVVSGATTVTVPLNQLHRSPNLKTVHGDREIAWYEVTEIDVASGQSVIVRLRNNNDAILLADAVRLDRYVSSSGDYDRNGNLISSTDTRGNVTDYKYDELNRQTLVKLPDPDGSGALSRLETETIYDGYGNRTSTVEYRGTSDDITNKYQYDKRNRLTQETIDEGAGRQNVTTKFRYNAVGNRTLVTDALGHETHYRYDGLDRVIDEYQDYGQGRATTETLKLVNPGITGVALANNDTSIELTGSVSAWVSLAAPATSYQVTHRTVLEFDLSSSNLATLRGIGIDIDSSYSFGENRRYFQLGGTGSFAGLYTTDFHRGPLPEGTVRLQIPIGQYLSESEKATGLLISKLWFRSEDVGTVLQPDRAKTTFSNIKLFESDQVRTVTTYDPRGNVATVEVKSDPRKIVTRYQYDLLDRQTNRILDATGSQARQYATLYDNAGNVLVEQSPSSWAESRDLAQTVHQYDHLYRLTRTTLPDADGNSNTPNGLTTSYRYDVAGNLIAETNGENETTRTLYDAYGRAIAELDGNGDETRYRYDSEGHLTSVTDAEFNVTKFTYDGLDRQTTETIKALVGGVETPLTRTNIYNDAGNLHQITDRNGRTRTFTYDTLDRRKTEAWSGVSGNVLTWQYDDMDRVIKETDGGTVNTYAYDGLGRLTQQTNYDPGVSGGGTSQPQVLQAYKYEFNLSGAFHDRVIRNQYAHTASSDTGIAQTISTFDRLGQLEQLDDFDSSSSTTSPQVGQKSIYFDYDHHGNMIGIDRVLPNNQFASRHIYDHANRLKSITHALTTDVVHSYAYDNASRVTNRVSADGVFGSRDNLYQYDDAGQVTAMIGESVNFYTYDDNGNRTSRDAQPVATAKANRLTSDGTYTYTYDNEGNVASRTEIATGKTTNYAWDHLNRLVSISEAPVATLPASARIGEVGQRTITQTSSSVWTPVSLQRTYTNPVVIAQLSSAADTSAAVVRVRNVTSTGFELQVSEWDSGDGAHADETVNYVVVEAGTYDLPGGGKLVAGKQNVTQSQSIDFTTISLGSIFSGSSTPPLVLSQVMTTNDATDVAISKLAAVQVGDFKVKVQEERAADEVHGTETVGYIAISAGSAALPGVGSYWGATTSQSITHDWSNQNLSPAFGAAPIAFAATQTNAENPSEPPAAWARLRNVAAGGLEVHVEEETSANNNTNHAAEKVALLAFAQLNFLYNQALIPTPPAPATAYTYDAQDRRVKRTHDPDGSGPQAGTSQYFVYDGADLSMVLEGATGSASVLAHRYLHGPLTDQVLVDEVFKTIGSQQVADELLWQLADHQGTVRHLVNEYGTLRKHLGYDAFGSMGATYWDRSGNQILDPSSPNADAVDQLFAYTGQEWDEDAELYNYNARWYDPTIGRFLSEDPSGLDPDANPYRYVGNDPVNHTDPTGLTQAGNPLNNLFAGGYSGNSVNPFKPINSYGASLLPAAPRISSTVAAPKFTAPAVSVVQAPALSATNQGFFERAANKVSAILPWQSFPTASLVTSFGLKVNAKSADVVVGGAASTLQHVGQVYDSVTAGEYGQAARQHLAFTLGSSSSSPLTRGLTQFQAPGLTQVAGPLSVAINPESAYLGQANISYGIFLAGTGELQKKSIPASKRR